MKVLNASLCHLHTLEPRLLATNVLSNDFDHSVEYNREEVYIHTCQTAYVQSYDLSLCSQASRELWTLVDAADDLSWCVLHYTGAAARAGTAYTGALLCSRDGSWPAQLDPSVAPSSNAEGNADGSALRGYARAEAAFAKCGLKMWELYGHGPPGQPTPAYKALMHSKDKADASIGSSSSSSSSGTEVASSSPASRGSYMWSEDLMEWTRDGHPPPLEPIGDITVQAWRAAEREILANASAGEATIVG